MRPHGVVGKSSFGFVEYRLCFRHIALLLVERQEKDVDLFTPPRREIGVGETLIFASQTLE